MSRHAERMARRKRAERMEALLDAGMVALLLVGFTVCWLIVFAGEFL
jgi:hypothetical protein